MVDRVDIQNSAITDYSSVKTDYITPTESVDGLSATGETTWDNPDFNKHWGLLNNHGDLKSGFLMKTKWTVGKGWTADNRTTIILENITGNGKQTFDDIIFNADLIKNINGDSYTEIMRDDEGTLINMKGLNPANMRTVFNSKGIIVRYEQLNVAGTGFIAKTLEKIKGRKVLHTFQPNQILHLMNYQLADQTHGISDFDALQETIEADKESFRDIRRMAHYQGMPFIIFKVKDDDQTTINRVRTDIETARGGQNDLVLPDDDNILSWEVVQITPSNFLLEWRNDLKNKFFRQIGMPEVLFGTSGATESGGKMEVWGHETVFAYSQRYMEKQLWNQVAIKLNLNSPQSLTDDIARDEKKDAGVQTQAIQPNDVQVPTR